MTSSTGPLTARAGVVSSIFRATFGAPQHAAQARTVFVRNAQRVAARRRLKAKLLSCIAMR